MYNHCIRGLITECSLNRLIPSKSFNYIFMFKCFILSEVVLFITLISVFFNLNYNLNSISIYSMINSKLSFNSLYYNGCDILPIVYLSIILILIKYLLYFLKCSVVFNLPLIVIKDLILLSIVVSLSFIYVQIIEFLLKEVNFLDSVITSAGTILIGAHWSHVVVGVLLLVLLYFYSVYLL